MIDNSARTTRVGDLGGVEVAGMAEDEDRRLRHESSIKCQDLKCANTMLD